MLHDRECRRRLAAPRLAGEAERLASLQLERDARDDLHVVVSVRVADAQILDAQHGGVAHRGSRPRTPRDVLERVADGEEREYEERDRDARRQHVPPRALVERAGLEAVVEHGAPRERGGAAEAEPREDRLAQHRERDDHDRVRPDDRHHVGEDVPPQDPAVRRALRASPLHERALAQGLCVCAHDARRPRPSGDRQHEHDDAGPAARDLRRVVLEQGRREQRERHEREYEEPVVEEGEGAVDPAPEVAGDDAGDGAEHDRGEAGREAHDDRDARTEQELREEAATGLVGAEPVRARGRLHTVREVETGGRVRVLRREHGAEDRHQQEKRDRGQPERAGRRAPDRAQRAHRCGERAPERVALGAQQVRDRLRRDRHQVARTRGSRAMISRSASRFMRITAALESRKMPCRTGRSRSISAS